MAISTSGNRGTANFGVDLRRLLKLAGERADTVARVSVMNIGKSLVMKSPVGDASLWKHPAPPGYVGGRFRANWQHGFNALPTGTVTLIDPSGSETMARINAAVGAAGNAGVHYFANNLPYAVALEYGHSMQAPQGIVGLTVTEFEQYVAQAAAYVAAHGAGATP